jgi:cysteinyl-tRNA synthetase
MDLIKMYFNVYMCYNILIILPQELIMENSKQEGDENMATMHMVIDNDNKTKSTFTDKPFIKEIKTFSGRKTILLIVLSLIFVFFLILTGLPTRFINLIFFDGTVQEMPIKDALNTYKSRLLYQLQDANISDIKELNIDYAIIDYSKDGTMKKAYSKESILSLSDSGIEVLSYISIGEAEDYRYYWTESTENASWLGVENPDWEGNYKVRYWDPEWQDIIFETLDHIIETGFNGVYLDIIDAFIYWSSDESNKEKKISGDPTSEEDAALRMISFVKDINNYCKSKNPDFLIVPQNGLKILDYDRNDDYINSIEGIGVESVWYIKTKERDAESVNNRLGYMKEYQDSGKFVLCIDYIDNGNGYTGDNKTRIDEFITNALREDFYFYIAKKDAELDEINTINY